MLPMEYDWRRHCSTSLGWNDPRGLDDDGIPLVENGLPRDAEAAVELDGRFLGKVACSARLPYNPSETRGRQGRRGRRFDAVGQPNRRRPMGLRIARSPG